MWPLCGQLGLCQGWMTLHSGARPGHGADKGLGANPQNPPLHATEEIFRALT